MIPGALLAVGLALSAMAPADSLRAIEAELLETLHARPPGVNVIITGRNAPAALCEAADLVTEMRSIKHPFQKGVRARPGIDY